jgi:outer membrane lipoprotein-sorting protein
MMSKRTSFILGLVATLGLPAALWAADGKGAPGGLTAAQIVEKHLAARGGLQAWHAVQTMSWAGKMDAGIGDSVARSQNYVKETWGKGSSKVRAATLAAAEKGEPATREEAPKQVELPFVLEMKRPGKSRVEVDFAGKTSIQVYDGKTGWLMRPYLNRDDWEPFSAEQAKSEADTWVLDGPLFDYADKGTKVALEGVEAVEGHDAWKLKLTTKSGSVHHVWIDKQTFLDVKVEGTPRRMDGKMRAVTIAQRDFRTVQGLKVPFLLETAVEGYRQTHKVQIDKVAVNPKLDDSRFTKPGA